jgi:hypothetical protein
MYVGVRADEVKADPSWIARLETVVFGTCHEAAASYETGFTSINNNFTFITVAGLRDGLMERPLPDTRKYDLLVGQIIYASD